jgi:putative redox protein
MSERPPTELRLNWEGGMRFRGEAQGGRRMLLDGDGVAGISPVESLGLALASCMGSDLVHILGKQRAELKACDIRFTGRRASQEPRRFLAIDLHFELKGELAPDRVEHAIALSREKYCSVWHSMQPDIELRTTFEIVPG